MATDKFLMVSLQEDKAKHISQVISNPSCRKILDYLAETEATESELSEKLKIPISTVHYNLIQLVKSNLVVSDEYHYSKKGKEIKHYKLANKYIIIAPKTTYGLKEKLKKIMFVFGGVAVFGGVLSWISKYMGTAGTKAFDATNTLTETAVATSAEPVTEILTTGVQTISEEAMREAPQMLKTGAQTLGDEAVAKAPEAVQTISQVDQTQMILFWFILGAFIALGLYFLIDYLMYKRKNKKIK